MQSATTHQDVQVRRNPRLSDWTFAAMVAVFICWLPLDIIYVTSLSFSLKGASLSFLAVSFFVHGLMAGLLIGLGPVILFSLACYVLYRFFAVSSLWAWLVVAFICTLVFGYVTGGPVENLSTDMRIYTAIGTLPTAAVFWFALWERQK